MGLPSGTVEMKAVLWQAALLDDQARPSALLGQPCLDLGLVLGVRLGGEQQMMRLLADVDAPRTRPGAGEDGVDRATDPQVAGDLGDPACEPLRIRARLPQVVDVGVIDVLDPHRTARSIERPHGSDDLHFRSFFPRAISVCKASSRFRQSARYGSSHSSTSASASGRRE
jgi:hypothetical protein